jgi:ABC-type multidrug transport system ATPase subunit
MFGMKLNPPILIMDEPMNHLDFNGQRQLIAQLLKLKERGALVIVSSHLLDIVHVASRCVLFDCGRLMRDKQWSDESLAQRMAWVAQVLSPLNQEGLVS